MHDRVTSFNFISRIQGVDIVYGLGGLHAAPNNKRFDSTDTHVIKTADVVSYYPNLAIRNKICAEHLPSDIFLGLYEGFFNERRNTPKSNPRNYILKILLNSAYGLSNDKFSFLRDRKVTATICINGQLLLTQLFEKVLRIKGTQLIMVNTDGFEVLLPRDKEDEYNRICKEWEKLTNLELEFDEYKYLIIYDVNNYIGLTSSDKLKLKGKLEYDYMDLGKGKTFKLPLHKNSSCNIVPKAVVKYFTEGIPVEETIRNEKNIYEFCIGARAKRAEKKGKSWFEQHSIVNGNIHKEKLNRTIRYFISKKGKWLFKCYEDGSQSHMEAPYKNKRVSKDWKITYFNRYYKSDNYDIDYMYYIVKAKEWIYTIENKDQLSLF
jgi:hypothetical protein